jgi:ribosomal protein S18 acetylase RimI-like enzyme
VDDELVLRQATPDDAGALAELNVAAWRWAYRGLVDADYLASLDPGAGTSTWAGRLTSASARTVVAEQAGAVVGFVSFGAAEDADATPAVGHVFAIYISESVQGSGVGRALIVHALEALAAEGRAEATLWVLDTNTVARTFYEAGGWRTDGAIQEANLGTTSLRLVRYRHPLP